MTKRPYEAPTMSDIEFRPPQLESCSHAKGDAIGVVSFQKLGVGPHIIIALCPKCVKAVRHLLAYVEGLQHIFKQLPSAPTCICTHEQDVHLDHGVGACSECDCKTFKQWWSTTPVPDEDATPHKSANPPDALNDYEWHWPHAASRITWPVTSAQIGKRGKQLDTERVYELVDVNPVRWQEVQ